MEPAQGNGTPQVPQGDIGDAPKYVTEEQLNRAITARLNDFNKRQEKTLGELFGSFQQKLVEQLEASKPAPAPIKEDPKIEESPLVKGMNKQLAEMKAKLEAAEQEKSAERARARELSMRQRVSEELMRNGIDSARAKAALALLVSEEKRVRLSDSDDELSFKDVDGTEVDLATGIRSWSKSEDAKIFLPAKNPIGSGSRQGGATAPVGPHGRVNKDALAQDILEKIREGAL